jgi:hypothetical protein
VSSKAAEFVRRNNPKGIAPHVLAFLDPLSAMLAPLPSGLWFGGLRTRPTLFLWHGLEAAPVGRFRALRLEIG